MATTTEAGVTRDIDEGASWNETLHNENTSLSQNPQTTVSTLMGYSPLDPNLPSLKYGRLLEPVARESYRALQEKNSGDGADNYTNCLHMSESGKTELKKNIHTTTKCKLRWGRTKTASGRAVSPDFWPHNVDITFHGVPGCTIPKYYATILPDLQATRPHIVYVELEKPKLLCFGRTLILWKKTKFLEIGLNEARKGYKKEETERHLDEVLYRLELARLTVKPSKCTIGVRRAENLGKMMGQREVSPTTSKFAAIQATRAP
ncbi:hypothetical protein Bbelb_186820 [Branchiostoma belcheri]|nr:hypothetical protein Bbelb_186820 [Branchiostoma belcheri]